MLPSCGALLTSVFGPEAPNKNDIARQEKVVEKWVKIVTPQNELFDGVTNLTCFLTTFCSDPQVIEEKWSKNR